MTWRPVATHIAEFLGLTHSRLFTPAARYPAGEPDTIWVLSPGDIPTTDIYLNTRLSHRADLTVQYFNTLLEMPPAGHTATGAYIIIVRHAPARWLDFLVREKTRLAGVAFLIDDDLPAAFADPDLPLRYAAKTAWRYARSERQLADLCECIWVSTPALQQKYQNIPTRVVPPLYIGRPTPPPPPGPTYFYHGTSSHRREIEWLVDIVAEVQKRNPRAEFEIFGNNRVQRLYRAIPRVKVLSPMHWRDFLAYTSAISHAVGLAPLLDTGFNTGRSYNKIFDITRCGAVGIYTDTAPFREPLGDGQKGVLCANDPAIWTEHICAMLADPTLCSSRYFHALAWCNTHNADTALRFQTRLP